jgi:hypothetical protein
MVRGAWGSANPGLARSVAIENERFLNGGATAAALRWCVSAESRVKMVHWT